jgi:hypothetical protein
MYIKEISKKIAPLCPTKLAKKMVFQVLMNMEQAEMVFGFGQAQLAVAIIAGSASV